ncbi:tetratricopeptide repeat protein [Spirosoma rigui]|uniref:tetratricopeptide repeat protein n=1 Tax=Spirosoma rigui TaxID=564064 RepID=UPI0009B0962D|nr:tetratricopeptide repeat protein [Spirosoma rigui]
MKRFFLTCLGLSCLIRTGLAQPARNTMQAIQYTKLANTLREVDKSQESISLLKRAMPAVKSKNLYMEAVINELMGLSYNDLKDQATALNYLEEARTQYTKLKYVASAWAVNEVIRDISGKNVYAGIQIGSSDITLVILKTKYESDFYEKTIQSTVNIPNATLFANASPSYQAGQNGLKQCLDSIQHYNIPNERIFVVLSSEARESLQHAAANKQSFYSQLTQALPNGALRIDTTITSRRQAELFTIGAIPRKVWSTTSALNIGGTSTIGGYIDPTPESQPSGKRQSTGQIGGLANRTFHGIETPVGVSSLVSKIENGRSLNMDAFRREAQRVVKTVTDTALIPQLTKAGQGFQKRSTVGLAGDIALAVVTYLHPERAGVTAVPITLDDMERFRRSVLTNYRALTRPDLSGITDRTVRETVENDLTNLDKQLDEKHLIAGTLWLESIMKAYNNGSSPKRFVFIRNADTGWVTGKFLETINYEYESTIAKGALYTR